MNLLRAGGANGNGRGDGDRAAEHLPLPEAPPERPAQLADAG
jgi:hypothetical protein